MSANNVLYIKRKTFEVFYQGCVDNGLKGAEKIGKGKSLEEAVDIANKYIGKELGGLLEYGIVFI